MLHKDGVLHAFGFALGKHEYTFYCTSLEQTIINHACLSIYLNFVTSTFHLILLFMMSVNTNGKLRVENLLEEARLLSCFHVWDLSGLNLFLRSFMWGVSLFLSCDVQQLLVVVAALLKVRKQR